jgi:hypothetical protein
MKLCDYQLSGQITYILQVPGDNAGDAMKRSLIYALIAI